MSGVSRREELPMSSYIDKMRMSIMGFLQKFGSR